MSVHVAGGSTWADDGGAGGGGAAGANKTLSNLTDPTAVNDATLTFTGAAGLKAGGTSQNITLQPSGPADATQVPQIGSIQFLDPTGFSSLSVTTQIAGGTSVQTYIYNDGYDVGDVNSFLRLVGQLESSYIQIGDGVGNPNKIITPNVTLDDGSGNSKVVTVNATTGLQINSLAPSGHYPRGNGTNYVDGTIQAGDLPAVAVPLTGTTSAIGGSVLAPGACVAGTVTITGATTAMVAVASPAADPDATLSTGIAIYSFVSSSNTVTVRVCALVAVTPAAVAYNVRVIQ